MMYQCEDRKCSCNEELDSEMSYYSQETINWENFLNSLSKEMLVDIIIEIVNGKDD